MRPLPGLSALLLVAVLLTPLAAGAQTTEADVFVARAIVLLEEKSYQAALEELRRALALESDHIEALYYAGVVYMAAGRPELAVQVLERARTKSPTEVSIAFQLGLSLFAVNQYDRAEPLLEEVFRQEPTLDGLGYHVGFVRYRKKDYQGALRAFREGRASDPETQQLIRLYTGFSLAAQGLPAQAAAEVEQAMRLAPASPLTGPTERLRDAFVAAQQRERPFRAEVRVGFLVDNNVRVLPPSSNDPTAESVRHHRKDSTGELSSLRLEYVWLRRDPWEATVSYSFFQTHYFALPSFDLLSHLGSTGVSYRGTLAKLPYQAGLQYSYDYLELDNDEFLQRNSVTLSGTLIEGPVHLTSVQGRFQTKEYSADKHITPGEDRDAKNWMAGFTHLFRFGEERHLLKLGYQVDREDTHGRNFVYLGHRLLAGGQYTLPWWDVRLKYDYDVHFRKYRHANSTLPERNPGYRERRDDEQTHSFKIEVPLPRNVTGLVEYQLSRARSNLPVYSFDREVLSLILSWQY